MSLTSRSITSARWNILVSALQVVLGVIRFILLSRWLDDGLFGVYAFATAVVGISILVVEFGLNEAYIHRDPATEDEEAALRVLFALRLILTGAWLAILLTWALTFTTGEAQIAVVVVTLAHSINHPLMHTAMALLTRRIVHRRLALRQLVSTFIGTGVSLWLAWQGAGLWALLATDLVNAVATVAILYTWKPVWRPRLQWIPDTVRYYRNFGTRSFIATLMLRTMDEIDDLWIWANLGQSSLGQYSRAFQLAIYPRQILAVPLGAVADGTYSALKHNPEKLSVAFARTNGLIIRSGFLLAGGLALTAPNFIPALLTDEFTPMVRTFQLMLIFALLDPVRSTIANLFVAVGQPERVIPARTVQFVVLVVGLFTLGPRFGIEGIALAVDLMLLVGMGILLWQVRSIISVSPLRLFGVPLLCLMAGGAAALLGAQALGEAAWWLITIVKLALFSVVYGGLLLLLEYRDLMEMRSLILNRRLP